MKIKNVNEDKHLLDLTVELDQDDIRKMLNSAFLLEKARIWPQYHQHITKDTLFRLFDNSDYLDRVGISAISVPLNQFVEENLEDELISRPVLISFDRDEDIIDVELFGISKPESFLQEDLTLDLPEFNTQIDEEKINERLENLRKTNARLVPTEAALKDGDTISVNIKTLNQKGETVSEENNKILDSHTLHSTYDFSDFEGHNIDEVVEYEQPTGKIQLQINQIYQPELPELDDDFAAEVSEFDTLSELKEDIKAGIIKAEYNSFLDGIKPEIWKQFFGLIDLDRFGERINKFKDQTYSEDIQNLYEYLTDPYIPAQKVENFDQTELFSLTQIVFQAIAEYLKKRDIDLTDEINKVVDEFLETGLVSIEGMYQQLYDEINQYRDQYRNSSSEKSKQRAKKNLETAITNIINLDKLMEVLQEDIQAPQIDNQEK